MKPLMIALLAGAGLAVVAGLGIGSPESTLIGPLVGAWLACLAVVVAAPRQGILVTAAGAAAANGYLFTRKWAVEGSESLCSVSETLNCDAINNSAQSEMFGIPITLLGLAFYAGLALSAAFKKEGTPQLYSVTALFMVPALLYSVFLGYISLNMGYFCMFCISIYVANVWLMGAAVFGMISGDETERFDFKSAVMGRSVGTIVTVFIIGVIGGYSVWQAKKDSTATGQVQTALTENTELPTDALLSLYSQPSGDVQLDGTEPIYGNPDAKYMIVEWADFGCGHCARAAVEFKALIDANPDLQLRFRPFPLSGECNPSLDGEGGTERCRAAMAAECAHQQDKFWDFSSKVFKNQRFLDDASLAFQADAAGMNLGAYEQCMADPATAEAIRADGEAGGTAGVRGTPGIFVFGLRDEPIYLTSAPDNIEVLIDAVESGRTLPAPAASPPGF